MDLIFLYEYTHNELVDPLDFFEHVMRTEKVSVEMDLFLGRSVWRELLFHNQKNKEGIAIPSLFF